MQEQIEILRRIAERGKHNLERNNFEFTVLENQCLETFIHLLDEIERLKILSQVTESKSVIRRREQQENKMSKFRKKPVVIEAMQYIYAKNSKECEVFCPAIRYTETGGMLIPTLEGDHLVSPNDWIIKGVKGEYYPCKPDVFEMTYEPVE
jgi:hypothetical protein